MISGTGGWEDTVSWIEIIADRKIRDAQDEGKFDNLPGRGQPLRLDHDPRVAPELRAAHRLMKEANVLPEWIDLDKQVRTRQDGWRTRADAFVERHAAETAAARPAEAGRLDAARDRFLEQAAADLRAINRLIDRLNLVVPTLDRQRPRMNLREQMQALEGRLPRLHPMRAGQRPAWEALVDEDRPPTRLDNRMPVRRRKGSLG